MDSLNQKNFVDKMEIIKLCGVVNMTLGIAIVIRIIRVLTVQFNYFVQMTAMVKVYALQ